MISTLLFTIVIETSVVIGYCVWRRKPIRSILITSLVANLITQLLLWGVLNLFFQNYLVTLLIAEVLIWILEGLILYYVRANQLTFRQAAQLSMIMNLVSFAVGWFLPV